ncbi:hypothetical protein GF1_00650 [Desulfolithobacter dissulfuricans]|uniref:Glycoside hydrolase 123 C-terminal domain-containing protein n=1 Tax=Desulfolithobacter dissulfuricans TaxID=2795293 RepID=A0A915TYQ6_9BACT|nr:hypothetical protein GF1_00650 [Desulfolithobacter dissulfuricans]
MELPSKDLGPTRYLPDPLVEERGEFVVPSNVGPVKIPGQQNVSLLCELYVPHDFPAGTVLGQLSITSGPETFEIPVMLTVWNFTLPNKLSFVPEMNAYGTVSPFEGYDYYRLAHEHRTCLNRLPYGWTGNPAFAPKWDGERFTWTSWDRAVGPLLDGTAFQGLPRSEEPVDVFYLPFNENWPVNLFDHYTPSYWADSAFDANYEDELTRAFSLFAEHCNEKAWHETMLQFYLNNKLRYRRKNPASSAPWTFDEPVDLKDFWALRWYGNLFHAAVAASSGKAKLCYRADISYSQFGRNTLVGVTDMEYLGGNTPQKIRMKENDALLAEGYFAEYGNVNRINAENTLPVLWCLAAWSRGAIGVLPWQTVGTSRSWLLADQNALFYPTENGPVPSLRLKAFTRGQQDVEYLVLYSFAHDQPFRVTAGLLKSELGDCSRVCTEVLQKMQACRSFSL